jgi:hypothetical protein
LRGVVRADGADTLATPSLGEGGKVGLAKEPHAAIGGALDGDLAAVSEALEGSFREVNAEARELARSARSG